MLRPLLRHVYYAEWWVWKSLATFATSIAYLAGDSLLRLSGYPSVAEASKASKQGEE